MDKKELLEKFNQIFYKKAAPLFPKVETERSQANQRTNTIAIIGVCFVILWLIVLSNSLEAAIVMLTIALLLAPLSLIVIKKPDKVKDYDTLLKAKLMQDFLAIFGDFEWNKKEPFLENYFPILSKLKNLKIFPSFFCSYSMMSLKEHITTYI